MVLRIFRHFVPVSVIWLGVTDLLLVSLGLCLIVPETSQHVPGLLHHSPAFQLSVLIAVGAVISGLYDRKSFLTYKASVIQILISLACCSAILVAAFYLTQTSFRADFIWELEKALLTWLVCILFTRALFLTVADASILKPRILVLGSGPKASRLAQLAKDRRNAQFVVVGSLSQESLSASVATSISASGKPDLPVIVSRARDLQADEIVIASDDRRGLPISELLQCRRYGIKVTDYLDFVERETNTIDIAALQPGWLLFSDGFRFSRWNAYAKRFSDIVLSLLLLVLTLPLMLLACLLIAFDSPGGVLYRQERVGLGGRVFTLLKLRSMRVDSEKDGTARWAIARDPRVTRVGRIIRKLRIDELPQLINVLRGDMSFVGPRPERPIFVNELTKELPFYAERHWVKPGITGWAQTKYQYGASTDDARIKLSYDLYYVKNRSLFLDLLIVLQTVRVILCADGAR